MMKRAIILVALSLALVGGIVRPTSINALQPTGSDGAATSSFQPQLSGSLDSATDWDDRAGNGSSEPHAGDWRTHVLTSGAEISVPPPPRPGSHQTCAELAELRTLQEQRTPEIQEVVNYWNTQPAFKTWIEKQIGLIQSRGINTPRAHRGLALVQVAVYDAVVAAWHWKYRYHRRRPDRLDHSISPSVEPPHYPTYPSEHAAIAGAASRVLAHLFSATPSDAEALEAAAEEAAFSRMQAGVNYRSDIEAGLALGRAVAALVIERRALTDGSSAVWDCVTQPGRRTGPGFWEPAAPPLGLCPQDGGALPVEPLAGDWRPWIIPATIDFLAEPPPGYNLYGTDLAAVCHLLEPSAREIMAHVAATRVEPSDGPRNTLILRWSGATGIRWNLIMLDLLASNQVNLPRAARTSALMNAALADSLYAGWKSKYTYWTSRPQNMIRQCGFDPGFTSVRTTPRETAYPSGTTSTGGAASEVLAFFFPEQADSLRAEAVGAGNARLYDGTHWIHDVEAGQQLGRAVAVPFIHWAKHDGACPPR